MSDPVVLAGEQLPPELAERLERELDEGEGLLWVGRPDVGLFVWRQWAPALVLAAMAMALAVPLGIVSLESLGTIRQASGAGGVPGGEAREAAESLWITGLFAVLLMLPMVWVLCFEHGRLRRIARNSVYAITPSRAIVLTACARKTIERDYRADELVHLLRKERPDGSGDLVFEAARAGRPRSQAHGGAHGFFGIDGVLGVEKLLRKRFGQHPAQRER